MYRRHSCDTNLAPELFVPLAVMFPCRYLTQTATFVLGSQNAEPGAIADFGPTLARKVVPRAPPKDAIWQRVDCKRVSLSRI